MCHQKAAEAAVILLRLLAGKRRVPKSDRIKECKQDIQNRHRSVGVTQRASHSPNELSGGERQRVAIARSLVNEPLIIFADEPTGNLDTKSGQEIMSILQRLNQSGKTIVMVTHEKEIAQYAKRIIHMRDGEIISDETVKAETEKVSSTSVNISA
ncbi:ATP-binding cassette domain-containing protein, partial [bacterium]|nr:ATP-binding cassette domain-containing protein [bacterium]